MIGYLPPFRIVAFAAIVVAGLVLAAPSSRAHSGVCAVKADDPTLRIENSTFPIWEETDRQQG